MKSVFALFFICFLSTSCALVKTSATENVRARNHSIYGRWEFDEGVKVILDFDSSGKVKATTVSVDGAASAYSYNFEIVNEAGVEFDYTHSDSSTNTKVEKISADLSGDSLRLGCVYGKLYKTGLDAERKYPVMTDPPGLCNFTEFRRIKE